MFWHSLARRNAEPGDFQKMGIGLVLMATGMVFFALGAFVAGGARVSLVWPLCAYICTGIGFFWYWPVLLSFVSRLAPESVKSLLMGVSYMSLFFAGLLSGYLGTLYEALTPVPFFLLNAAFPAAGVVFVLLFGSLLKRALEPKKSKGLP